jgi:hypothetical protein
MSGRTTAVCWRIVSWHVREQFSASVETPTQSHYLEHIWPEAARLSLSPSLPEQLVKNLFYVLGH